ncbi:peptidoglycan-binding protein [Streptomyces sp. NPDC005752]|uniref:C40 family peptidase n=1 Tax=Streptomyces sp. NPDC005752 TaxID=3157065 RepID=UPI0033F65409
MPHLSRSNRSARTALATAVAGVLTAGGLLVFPSGAVAAPEQAAATRSASAGAEAASLTRDEVLRRAKTWLTADNGSQVPYSQESVWKDGYRQDCSGYVSMTLGLWKSGPNTVELAGNRSLTTPIGVSELLPGDLLIDASGSNTTRHVVIFAGWTSSAHTAYQAYEQRGGHGTDHRVLTYGLGANSEYKPYRPVKLGGGGGTTPTPPSSGWSTLSQGSSGAKVEAAQYLLTSHGYATTADGVFGSLTDSRVKAFQKAEGLVADGVIGPLTWSALVRTVQEGSSGASVRAAQTALNARGHSLVVDGVFGGLTDSAARAFQQKKGLVADGVVGPKTWQALMGS